MDTVKSKSNFYRTAIAKLNLSQPKAAEFFGFSGRQSRRLAGGHAELGGAEEKLLRVMLHTGLTVEAVNKICDPKATPKASKKKPAPVPAPV